WRSRGVGRAHGGRATGAPGAPGPGPVRGAGPGPAAGNPGAFCHRAWSNGGVLTALLTGLGLGALVAAQVGPVSLLCIRTTLRYGFAPGLAVGAGAAAVDTAYGGLGMLGAASLVAISPLRVVMGLVGPAALCVLGARTLGAASRGAASRGRVAMGLVGAAGLCLRGARTLWSAHRVRSGLEGPSEVVTVARALRTALAATASNPLTIASWATAFAAASTAS